MAHASPHTRAERAAERQKAERRAKASCHRAAVNGVEGGVPEEGDRVAFEWKFDDGELFHEFVLYFRCARVSAVCASPVPSVVRESSHQL